MMKTFRPLNIIVMVLNFSLVLNLNPTLFGSLGDNLVERKCMISVFVEFVRPMLSSTNSNSVVLLNLPPTQITDRDYILKMFHQEFSIIVNGWASPLNRPNYNSKIDAYILFCTHIAEVTDAIGRWKSSITTWNPTASVFIFLSDTSASNSKIRRILMKFLHNKILNVNVIRIGVAKIEIVTWFPYDGENCGKYIRNLEIVAECSLETSRYNAVETKKLVINKPYKCPLKAISLEWAPYAFFNNKTGKYVGFEVELLNSFADKMNFDLILSGVPYNSREISKELLIRK